MRKHYTAEEKAKIVLEILKEDRTIAQIVSDLRRHPPEPTLQVEKPGCGETA